MAMAPLDRQTETIIGSISGVRPTATAKAKKKAPSSSTSCAWSAVDEEHQRHHDHHEADHQPGEPVDALVEAGLHCLADDGAWPCCPDRFSSRWSTTTAVAVPLSTLVPRKQMLFSSSSGLLVVGFPGSSNFSTGKDSPVRLAWMMNKSLQDSMRTIGGNHVAGRQLDHVAGHQFGQRNFAGLPVADHRGGHADHGLELGGGGSARPPGRNAAHAQDDHDQHDGGRPDVARQSEMVASTSSRITSGIDASVAQESEPASRCS